MPVACWYRILITSQNTGSSSMVLQQRSSWSQVIRAESLPPKKLTTTPLCWLLFIIGMASRSRDFWVGWTYLFTLPRETSHTVLGSGSSTGRPAFHTVVCVPITVSGWSLAFQMSVKDRLMFKTILCPTKGSSIHSILKFSFYNNKSMFLSRNKSLMNKCHQALLKSGRLLWFK